MKKVLLLLLVAGLMFPLLARGETFNANNKDDYSTGLIIPEGDQIYRMPQLLGRVHEFLQAMLGQAGSKDREIISGLMKILDGSGAIGFKIDTRDDSIGFFEPGLVYCQDPGLKPPVQYSAKDRGLVLGIARYLDVVNRHVFDGKYRYPKTVTAVVNDVHVNDNQPITSGTPYVVKINYTVLLTHLTATEPVEDRFIGTFNEDVFITDVHPEQ
ncbi:MAG: hypothetical protein PHW04_02130 [Candidatus Wallbacteria bacterium]|nr:hypothetical protein [Candidatus Wallbacteria bacterium]